MSRKGRLPINIPKGVEVKTLNDEVHVKGPKGSLQQKMMPFITIKIDGNVLHVELKENQEEQTAYQGLYRALIENMIIGTTKGFEKKLEMIGVGYRAAVQGTMLDLQIGYSHPTKLPIPKGITVAIDKGTALTITGIDKREVGQFAASVRDIRPPEPYQGKGIRYKDEYVRKKAGKAAAAKK